MNKIKTFFYVLFKTFTSVDYYGEILKVSFKFSLKFFFAFFFLYSLIATVIVTVTFLLPLNTFLTTVLPDELAKIYPENLVITLRDGSMSTNVDEPFFLPLSRLDNLINEFDNSVLGTTNQKPTNLLVIDTQAKLEDFPQYQTLALLTKHHLSVINDNGNVEVIPLTDIENFTLDKQTINKLIEFVSPFLNYLLSALVGITFIGFLLFAPGFALIYTLWLSLILKVLSHIVSRPLTYMKTYQLGLHLVVISTTFFSLWRLTDVNLNFTMLQTILLSILGLVIIRHNVRAASSVTDSDIGVE